MVTKVPDGSNFGGVESKNGHLISIIEKGFRDQVLIAHDVCYKSHYKQYGGKGFDYIITGIIPRLRKHGFSNKDINMMLVDNPAKAVAFC